MWTKDSKEPSQESHHSRERKELSRYPSIVADPHLKPLPTPLSVSLRVTGCVEDDGGVVKVFLVFLGDVSLMITKEAE